MHARVLHDVRTRYPDPIGFAARDIVKLGSCDDEWPALAWVQTHDANAGWASVEWRQPRGDGRAEPMRDYSARELDADADAGADAGDVVILHSELGGWWWAERADGTQGRRPARALDPIDEMPNEISA